MIALNFKLILEMFQLVFMASSFCVVMLVHFDVGRFFLDDLSFAFIPVHFFCFHSDLSWMMFSERWMFSMFLGN